MPQKIILFVAIVLFSLLGFTFVSKSHTIYNEEEHIEEEIQGFKIGNQYIKYPIFASLIEVEKKVTNDKASEILSKKIDSIQKDTLKIPEKIEEKMRSNEEGLIHYPGNPEKFVQKMHEKLSENQCRIIHYGASKIEGDRITSHLRNGLQEMYGGSGPGYFPIKMPYSQKSIQLRTRGNWYRYALFNAEHRKTKNLLKNNQYGLYANVCRFTAVNNTDKTTQKTASFFIAPSQIFYEKLRKYNTFELHYGNSHTKTNISVYENGKILTQDTLISDGKYHNYKLTFPTTPKEIQVTFSGVESPDFYGITLGSDTGVQMDNVPTRGDSGLHFIQLQNSFDAMSKELSPDIIIFEFGGNLVPWLRTDEQIQKNVRQIIENMLWVQKRNPEALFILVGPSDMLNRKTGTSFKILPKLVSEMKAQALENGFAFWSMYEAMGGENSMKIWFDKGFGATDYIHFTNKGTDKISELFFNALQENLIFIQNKNKTAVNNTL